jgi:hypothetical protein
MADTAATKDLYGYYISQKKEAPYCYGASRLSEQGRKQVNSFYMRSSCYFVYAYLPAFLFTPLILFMGYNLQVPWVDAQ